jgi:hypothetical protein
MPTTIDSAGITFNDATSLTSAVLAANSVGATQIANGSVTAAKLGTTEQKQICKAWVNFDGTTSPGTIRSSYNVSSVTKNGTGDYTVNFATALTDANYVTALGGGVGSTGTGSSYAVESLSTEYLKTTLLYRFYMWNYNITQKIDRSNCYITVFGN